MNFPLPLLRPQPRSTYAGAESPRLGLLSDQRLPLFLLLLGLLQVLMWGVGALAFSSTDLDSSEQLVWGTALEAGYWKHPPLPSWIMHAALAAFGPSAWLPLVISQLGVIVALALVWRLSREFLPTRQAALSVLLTSLVFYHNGAADTYNHNTAMLPFQAATVLAFFFAARRGDMRWWAAAGLFAGLSMLVKYVAVLPLAGLVLYLMFDRSLHHRRTFAGVALAAAIFALVISPHVVWLYSNDFPPMRYAHSVMQPLVGAKAHFASVVHYLLTQFYRFAPVLPALIFLAFQRRRADVVTQLPLAQRDKLFIWLAGVAPLAMTVLFGLVTHNKLEPRWGANVFLLSGLLAVMLMRPVLTPRMLKTVIAITVVMQVLICAGSIISKTAIADHKGQRTRANFPAAELAQSTRLVWHSYTDAPLRIIASDFWLGGNLRAFGLPDAEVMIDGDAAKSPWVTPEDLYNCGAMVLDDQITDRRAGSPQAPELDAMIASAPASGTFNLAWGSDGQERHAVRWAYLPPHSPTLCR
ncbi:glycosyltransferase family 39 protein [Pseudoduganella sp. RAF19]|uniref:glycosyltransferase family 39 protein n=1 Tax=Pseudoduganella sp. RAF19 TaxID=3233052 RepID=UPI003F94FF3D